MKLNKFDNETMPRLWGGGNISPRISFGKAGTISFNRVACENMNLFPGVKLTLAQDEENPENWYVFKDDKNGFEIRKGYDKTSCMLNHSKLVKEFAECFELEDDKTHSFTLAGEATLIEGDKTEYWGILINN